MSGRTPLPTTLKAQRGTLRPARVNGAEPVLEPLREVPAPPAYLPLAAQAAWHELATAAIVAGVLTAVDLEMLALAAGAVADYRAADAWRQRDAAWKRVLTALREFGLSPSSRTRVHVAGPSLVEDPMAALLEPRRRRQEPWPS